MKKIIIAAAVLVSLTACGSKTVYVVDTLPSEDVQTTEAPQTTVKVTTTTKAPITQPPVSWTDEDQFLASVKSVNSQAYYEDDSLMIQIGYAMCDHFRQGGDSYSASDMIVRALPYDTNSQKLAAAITAAAVIYFCPDQGYKLED